MKRILIGLVLVLIAAAAALRFIHIEVSTTPTTPKPEPLACQTEVEEGKLNCEALSAIALAYKTTAEPILQQKCASCHGVVYKMPLYSQVPPIKAWISHHIEEGKEHFDMSHGFPFGGRGDQHKILDEVLETLEDGSMPPAYYRSMHWQSKLDAEEKQKVIDWVKNAQMRIKGEDFWTP